MGVFQIKIEADGTIQIPAQFLEQSDFEAGQIIEIEVEKKSLHVSLSAKERIKRAQARIRQYIPEGISLVDELIADRRHEAEND